MFVYSGDGQSPEAGLPAPSSMGLAGIRTPDNMALFEPKRPLAVVYFDIDYERNPKGQGEGALSHSELLEPVTKLSNLVSLSLSCSAQGPTTGETG